MNKLYPTDQIRQLEVMATEDGTDEWELMQLAGKSAFAVLHDRWPLARHITVCCGSGNNGGDGMILAYQAKKAGLDVVVYYIGDPKEFKPNPTRAFKLCQSSDISMQPFSEQPKFETDLIVDGLLGIGLTDEVREPIQQIIAAINATKIPVLALDVPSGIDSNTGRILGAAVQADVTVTFIGAKQGLYTNKAPAYAGKIVLKDLNISASIFQRITPSAYLINWDDIQIHLPRRVRYAHKGDYGHVLVIGGDYGMGGAVRMAAEAAMRVGAGLTTVATRPEHVSIVSASRPEIMCYQVREANDLDPLLKRATVAVIGPGLGKSDWAKALLKKVLNTQVPKVLDADSLNLLSENPLKRDDWILTPHPGEASRLLNTTSQVIQDDRFEAAKTIQKQYGGVAILKGAGTIIQNTACTKVCPVGNPGMASGGMGDILSGVIGGLLAQGLTLIDAATTGVMVHGFAADLAAQQGGERGLLASDLMVHLRKCVNPYR